MKPMLGVGPFCAGILVGALIVYVNVSASPIEKSIAPQVGLAEVSDLLARLRPLVKEPNGPWYSNGLELTFTGSGAARLKLKMPNGDEYSGSATTLNGAVATLGQPSAAIQNALKGWNEKP